MNAVVEVGPKFHRKSSNNWASTKHIRQCSQIIKIVIAYITEIYKHTIKLYFIGASLLIIGNIRTMKTGKPKFSSVKFSHSGKNHDINTLQNNFYILHK